MIVVDSSVLVAIVFFESGAETFTEKLAAEPDLCVGAATMLEAAMVVEGQRGDKARSGLDEVVSVYGIEIVPFDAAQLALARDAFLRFGKGRHKASLNFGDCMSYALAKSRNAKLLYKGTDFAATDVATA